MKLVLLPGLDGTGLMFAPFLSLLQSFDTQIIPFPQSGSQDYNTLKELVKSQLPNEDFVLIAESFSGPIAAMLAKENIKKMRGVVFVATFLSPPNIILLNIAKILPLKILSKFPFSKHMIRALFLGRNANNAIVELFLNTVKSLSSDIIKARISSIKSLTIDKFNTEVPAIYVLALNDKLIPKSKSNEFKLYFKRILVKEVAAPHFLLQTTPNEAAETVKEFIRFITRNSK